MIHFKPGHCEVHTTIPTLKKFANDTYYRYHKSNRLKHMTLSNDRYPNLKITDDIFSLSIWIKTREGEEQRIFLDGDVFLNNLVIHTITFDGSQFTEEAYEEMNRVLKGLSSTGKGYIYAEVHKVPTRYQNGKVVEYKNLLDEIYSSLPEDKKEMHRVVYEALQTGFSLDDEEY
ncbi:hypothetical protein [Bacillus thuringiensis]|uniref:hypothetical protein n=1 Tax=Bacillus thuringiensis TaxID=1428 RepID=UPI0021D692C0|nr:hypothetical protein [Bacillus thuringiensis]MCU7667989.1 hypothetical protein [Bacillus thuringiensis]